MPHLRILNGPARGRIIILGTDPCRIGRDPSVEVCLGDSKASRVHVELTIKDGQVILRDLRSKNGTLVNGTSISALTLKEGDQIQIGETRIAFSMQDAPPVPIGHGHNLDSVVAARLPVGVMPALGSAGIAQGHAGESFETLELNAPLALLEGGAKKAAETAEAQAVVTDAATYERANRALRALYSIARAAAEAKSSNELLLALTEGLRTALEADRVTAIALDEKGHWDITDLGKGAPDAEKQKGFAKVPVSRTIVDYALRTRRSVLTATKFDSRFGQSKSIGEQGISSAISVPIMCQDQAMGLLYADRLGGQDFVRADQELVTAACLQAAPALANLRRLEEALARKELLVKELKSQHNLLGESARMRDVTAFIERAAPTSSVVLVLGESGTGKELVARAIHYSSRRCDASFVVVNCAALTETLIESELFGHAKGAFTGATSDRAGRFEMAHEGSIFLDEIGELSNSCQTKLLRVLEQGELSRVGESRVRKVDVRIVAATNRDLQAEVKAGRFREDLFYRLNVLAVSLPPLRDRGDDVRLLLDHYLHDAAVRSGRPKLHFSEEALAVLLRYRWPGNVRELRNLTERLAVLCANETIGVADLPAECARPAEAAAGADPATPAASATALRLSDVEKDHILHVLKLCENNKKLAAEKLGIDRSTLYAKLRAYGILAPESDK